MPSSRKDGSPSTADGSRSGGGRNGGRKGSVSSEGEDSVAETLAERRALHNSVERTRREALNSKFTHLAQQLPSLAHIHRPSKSVIISHCLDMVVELKDIKAENEALKQELFHMRLSSGTASGTPLRSQLRLNPSDVLASSRSYDGMESNSSPRPLGGRRHDRSPLGTTARSYRGPYSTPLPSSYLRPQIRSHQRHSLTGGVLSHENKGSPSAFWHEPQSRLRLQSDVYPIPDYAMANEHFAKLNSESSHSSAAAGALNDCGDAPEYPVPAFFPSEYGQAAFEMSSQQTPPQYLVKSEDAGLV